MLDPGMGPARWNESAKGDESWNGINGMGLSGNLGTALCATAVSKTGPSRCRGKQ